MLLLLAVASGGKAGLRWWRWQRRVRWQPALRPRVKAAKRLSWNSAVVACTAALDFGSGTLVVLESQVASDLASVQWFPVGCLGPWLQNISVTSSTLADLLGWLLPSHFCSLPSCLPHHYIFWAHAVHTWPNRSTHLRSMTRPPLIGPYHLHVWSNCDRSRQHTL